MFAEMSVVQAKGHPRVLALISRVSAVAILAIVFNPSIHMLSDLRACYKTGSCF
jgi:hypothetical protein